MLSWRSIERLLNKILPPQCVRFILDVIERLGGPGEFMARRIFEVLISRGKWGIEDITVQPAHARCIGPENAII